MGRLIAIGSVRGNYTRLANLMDLISPERGDTFVFLGNYAGGNQTADVIEYLLEFSAYRTAVFLMGRNDSRFLDFIQLPTEENLKGWNGIETIESYIGNVPQSHKNFLGLLGDYYLHETISYTMYLFTNGMLDPSKHPLESIKSTKVFWDQQNLQNIHPSWNKGFFNIFSSGPRDEPTFVADQFLCIDTGCGIEDHPLTACEIPKKRTDGFRFFKEDS